MDTIKFQSALWLKLIIQAGVLFAVLFASVPALAGNGDASFLFTDKVSNPPGSTPQISLALEWRDGTGAFVSRSLVVTVAPGDDDEAVRDKVQAALQADPVISAAFTLSPDDAGWGAVYYVKLTHNGNNFACSAFIMNGVKTGTPPTLTNTVAGLGMSAGVDPTPGSVFFNIEGMPSSGLVEIAAEGIVISIQTDGKSIPAIKDEAIQKLRAAGFQAKIESTGQILVSNVSVDNLADLGLRGRGRLDFISGGASFYVTDLGIAMTATATQHCPLPSRDEPPRLPKIYYLVVIVLSLLVVVFAIAWFRRRPSKKTLSEQP